MTVMTMVLATDTSGKNPSADLPPQDLYVERVAVARRLLLACHVNVKSLSILALRPKLYARDPNRSMLSKFCSLLLSVDLPARVL